jgi:GTP cyclohydrolase II
MNCKKEADNPIPSVVEEDECKDWQDESKLPNDIEIVELGGCADLPTKAGEFTIYGFYDKQKKLEHTALVHEKIEGVEGCPVRIHSQCHTGDVLGSLRCDCREQLEQSIEYIGKHGPGLLIYLKQEGRGIGLINKIRAYHMQDLGLDTVEANHYLGFPADVRDFTVAAAIIRRFGITSVSLITNNPFKMTSLEEQGIKIQNRIPLKIPPNPYNAKYLDTKRNKMGHLL